MPDVHVPDPDCPTDEPLRDWLSEALRDLAIRIEADSVRPFLAQPPAPWWNLVRRWRERGPSRWVMRRADAIEARNLLGCGCRFPWRESQRGRTGLIDRSGCSQGHQFLPTDLPEGPKS